VDSTLRRRILHLEDGGMILPAREKRVDRVQEEGRGALRWGGGGGGDPTG